METQKKTKKPIDYSKGKIYKIVCDTTGLVYIGSTIQKLCERLSKHKDNYKRYLKGVYHFITSFDIIKNNNYKIILIENYACNSKEELHREERKYIESIECVNKVIPGRTDKEYREDNKDKIKEKSKEYRENNREKILEYHKEYYENNKTEIKKIQKEWKENNIDEIKEYYKEYYENNKDKLKERQKNYYETNKDKIKEYKLKNKDKIKEQKKEYYENNKDKIEEYKKQKIECEYCNSNINKSNIKQHQKSLKCKKFQLLVNED